VAGWFMKAADYGTQTKSAAAFVSTNSICQGQQVPILWSLIFKTGHEINFAHTSFKWANLASHNAGVTVVIVGIAQQSTKIKYLFSLDEQNKTISQEAKNINAYLVAGENIIIESKSKSENECFLMEWGNKPTDGGYLTLSSMERQEIISKDSRAAEFICPYYGAAEYIRGLQRFCIWVEDEKVQLAEQIQDFQERFEKVKCFRLSSKAAETRPAANFPHKFRQIQSVALKYSLILPQVSSERREYLPIGLLPQRSIVSNLAFALYDAPLWNMSLIASRLHLVWIATVCGKLETRYRYSNTLGWNTFPVPFLTEQNKKDLTHCAEDILLAREEYFPATIAEMYDPNRMDQEFPLVRQAHERNDDILERIYIGRRFKNDTERLEKLFEMYTKMTGKQKK